MTTDPGPFLSTIVAASATLAAIIGGLLVARFVSLDSDQRGNRKVLADARGRLDAAKARSQEAARDVVVFDAKAFFRADTVLSAVDQGTTTADDLKRGRVWEHDDADLESCALDVAEEFARAREELARRGLTPESDWPVFRRLTKGLPEIRWPQVWRRVHDEMAMKAAEEEDARQSTAPRRPGPMNISFYGPSAVSRRRAGEFTASLAPDRIDGSGTDARRRDELLARRERTAQQAEDCESELRRLEQDHVEIARPDSRLWWGIGIVVVFAITGVALPVWEMSQGARSLASVRWLFWPFAAALVALIVYIVTYLVLLTRRKAIADNG